MLYLDLDDPRLGRAGVEGELARRFYHVLAVYNLVDLLGVVVFFTAHHFCAKYELL